MAEATRQTTRIEQAAYVLMQIFPRVLGMLFVWTGLQKIHDPKEMLTILQFDGFPESIVPAIGWMVISMELVAGTLLIFLRPRPWLLAMAGGMLIVFLGQLSFLLLSSDAPNFCGCGFLEAVLADQARHHAEQQTMFAFDLILLLATAATWLQLPAPSAPGFPVDMDNVPTSPRSAP